MLRIGPHVSYSKGFLNMAKAASSIGANTFQYFMRNPRGARAKAIDEKDLEEFKKFIEENNITYLGREGDDFKLKMEGEEKHLNAFGIYHGGVIFTLADTAAGLLLIDDGITAVTLQSNVNFVGNIKGGPLFTHTRYVHKGTTTYVVEAEVRSEDGTLLLIGIND